MIKKILIVILLFAIRAHANDQFICGSECEDGQEGWTYQEENDEVTVRRCKCKCYDCLKVRSLTVTGTATIQNLNATNQTISNASFSGDVEIGGNLDVAGTMTGTTASLNGALNVDGDITAGGDIDLGSGAVLTQVFLNYLLSFPSYGSYSNTNDATAIPNGSPLTFNTQVSTSDTDPVTNPNPGQFVIPVAGNYIVNFTYAATLGGLTVEIFRNALNTGVVFTTVGPNNIILGNTFFNDLEAGDIIEVRNTGSPITPSFTVTYPTIVIQKVL